MPFSKRTAAALTAVAVLLTGGTAFSATSQPAEVDTALAHIDAAQTELDSAREALESLPAPAPPAPTVTVTATPIPAPEPTVEPEPEPEPTVEPAPAGRLFGSAEWLDTRIPNNPRLDSQSGSMVSHLASGSSQIGNVGPYGVTRYEATGNEPRYAVTLTNSPAWGPNPFSNNRVRLTSAYQPSSGTDGAMVIIDRDAGYSYELWQYSWNNGNPRASFGAIMPLAGDASTGIGATGAGISRTAGIVTAEEFRAGVIPHALVFSSDNSCRTVFRYPASKTDGNKGTSNCIPEGARVQLNPSFDTSRISDPKQRAVAVALQRYGAYNIDNGGARMGFIFEAVRSGSNPYAAAGWNTSYASLSQIPWSSLRVLGKWNGAA